LGFGFWVWGLGFEVLGFGVWVLGFGFWILGLGVWTVHSGAHETTSATSAVVAWGMVCGVEGGGLRVEG